MDTSDVDEANKSSKKKKNKSTDGSGPSTDEYNLDNYDEDEIGPAMGLGDIAIIDTNENLDDDQDSEEEDDIIKPSDNLILVGHVENDSSILEVYSEFVLFIP